MVAAPLAGAGFALRDLGGPAEAGARFLGTLVAPPGSGRATELLRATQRCGPRLLLWSMRRNLGARLLGTLLAPPGSRRATELLRATQRCGPRLLLWSVRRVLAPQSLVTLSGSWRATVLKVSNKIACICSPLLAIELLRATGHCGGRLLRPGSLLLTA